MTTAPIASAYVGEGPAMEARAHMAAIRRVGMIGAFFMGLLAWVGLLFADNVVYGCKYTFAPHMAQQEKTYVGMQQLLVGVLRSRCAVRQVCQEAFAGG